MSYIERELSNIGSQPLGERIQTGLNSAFEDIAADPGIQALNEGIQTQIEAGRVLYGALKEDIPNDLRTLREGIVTAVKEAPLAAEMAFENLRQIGRSTLKHPLRIAALLGVIEGGISSLAPISAESVQAAIKNRTAIHALPPDRPETHLVYQSPLGEQLPLNSELFVSGSEEVPCNNSTSLETPQSPETPLAYYGPDGKLLSKEVEYFTPREIELRPRVTNVEANSWSAFKYDSTGVVIPVIDVGEICELTCDFAITQGISGQPGSHIILTYNNPASGLQLLGYYSRGMDVISITNQNGVTRIEATWRDTTCTFAPVYKANQTGNYQWDVARSIDSETGDLGAKRASVQDIQRPIPNELNLDITVNQMGFPYYIVLDGLEYSDPIPYKVIVDGQTFESTENGQIKLPSTFSSGIHNFRFILPPNRYVAGNPYHDQSGVFFNLNHQLRLPNSEVRVGPDYICSGWNTVPSFGSQNTLGIPLHNVRVRTQMPGTCNYLLEGSVVGQLGDTPIEGVINGNIVEWNIGTWEPDVTLNLTPSFHTRSNLPAGTAVEFEYVIEADEFNGRPQALFTGKTIIQSNCATPTPDATLTPTPRPTSTETPRPTGTETPRPTGTETPRSTGTSTPEPTGTSTPEPTNTSTKTPKATATSTKQPTVPPTPGEHRVYIPIALNK